MARGDVLGTPGGEGRDLLLEVVAVPLELGHVGTLVPRKHRHRQRGFDIGPAQIVIRSPGLDLQVVEGVDGRRPDLSGAERRNPAAGAGRGGGRDGHRGVLFGADNVDRPPQIPADRAGLVWG